MPKGNRIVSAIETAILSRVKSTSLFSEYYKRTESRVDYTRQATLYKAQEIKDWKLAIASATDPYFPRRGNLSRFYQSLKLDNHLSSVIDSRIMRVQRSSYKIVNDAGVENEDLKKLLERPWFDDLVRLVVGKVFQGTTLIELFDLDETGELAHVKEIPQTNFIAQTGLILNFEWDMDGTSYKEGIYADYYIQVGDDWELGMLNELAMIILAKKLGLGSWMSYIDKFGVPPVFVTTDRQDPKRAEELFEMLTNFRSNNFTILKGNEKVEIPNNYQSDAYQSFKALNEFADEQISKRVLGNTASTDKKAFVGAAEVQERVSQDRYEADKLLFKYFFNTQIRQRLAKLSSVYADFATHTIIYDNQETIAINDYIKGVADLAQFFDFDTEEIKKRTGLPITGIKPIPVPIVPPVNDPQKKKSNASVAGANYSNFPFAKGQYPKGKGLFYIHAATWDAATERLATQLYNGEIKPSDLDKDLVLKNYSSLSKSAESAYGKNFYNEDIPRKMRDNLIKFSGAKSYDMMTKLDSLKDKKLDRESFLQEAKKVVNLHNETYLNVERTFTASSASAAKDWVQFVKDKDIYPNLQYRTMEDEFVREEHAVLDGIIKPLDDPFWDEYMPPNGFRCRCFTEQTMDDPSVETPVLEIPDQFRNNPGKDGCVFTNDNSYQQSITQKDSGDVRNNMELMKQFAPYNHVITTDAENKVFVSDFADASDLSPNVVAATQVADYLNTDIYVRPHTYSSNGVKNPEYGIGTPNTLGDLKTFEPKKSKSIDGFLTHGFKDCAKKGCKYAVCDVSLASQSDIDNNLVRRLYGSLKADKDSSIEQVIIINGKKTAKISRKQIAKLDFTDLMKHI